MNTNKNIASVLIDFDNLFKKKIDEYSLSEFERVFKNIVGEIIRDDDNIDEIIIRLYGGWYTENELNNKASAILSIITNLNVFPYVNISKMKRVFGSIELAFSLLSIPDYKWENTHIEKKGLPNLRINNELLSETCITNTENCPIKIMKKFTKRKGKICSVEGCSNTNRDVFVGYQQKMVDTLLTCDLITVSEKPEHSKIILISDDTDFFPALAMTSLKKQSFQDITVAIKNDINFETYFTILTQFGINVKLHEYD